jgi:hypothetical protein
MRRSILPVIGAVKLIFSRSLGRIAMALPGRLAPHIQLVQIGSGCYLHLVRFGYLSPFSLLGKAGAAA